MISYLAVVFFCIKGDCYFYNGQKLHQNEAACVKELQLVEAEMRKGKVDAHYQCLKVSMLGA